MSDNQRIYSMKFSKIYLMYLQKTLKKGRTQAELDAVIEWLTGYSKKLLEKVIDEGVDLKTFFDEAPHKNPKRSAIKGVICGIRVEDIKDDLMREIRYLDKLVDELAKDKKLEFILRE
ncbi:MAG: DUF2200 domain-containing protein [Patescibacteria group bacterium]